MIYFRFVVARTILEFLPIPREVLIITRDLALHVKPEPDLLLRATERLGINIEMVVVEVGNSIWDLLAIRRAQGTGLLFGAYSEAELAAAGALRVYDDPADPHLDETGVPRAILSPPHPLLTHGIGNARLTPASSTLSSSRELPGNTVHSANWGGH